MSAAQQTPAVGHTVHRVNLAGHVRYELRRADGSMVGHFVTVEAAELAAAERAAWAHTFAALVKAAGRAA